MSPHGPGSGNLLINGAFLPGLWTRLEGRENLVAVAGVCDSDGSETVVAGVCDPGRVATRLPGLTEASNNGLRCPVDRETFAADRWAVRYAAPEGGAVTQARSSKVLPDAAGGTSLEIVGHAELTQAVYLGQKLEADEALGYRRELRFAAWCLAEHPTLRECPVRLLVRHPQTREVFDATAETLLHSPAQNVPVGVWKRVEFVIEASAARTLGLSVELELPAAFLGHAGARFSLASAALWPVANLEPACRPVVLETLLARRFCQRHSAQTINALGRALVCNAHELHFQFTFPELRAFPSVSLPQSNDELTVFSPDGIPHTGFTYDVPYRSRGSVIIRATKLHHRLPDGYLAFRGYGGAILLEAEL